MSVELKISVKENCGALYFFDETCSYSKCNKTGWGNPNTEIKGAHDAKLFVYPPKTDEPIEVVLSADFPSSTVLGYEILPEDLKLEKIVSGVWRFDYEVRDAASNLLFVTEYEFFDDEVTCCVSKKISGLNVCENDSDAKDAILYYSRLEAARDAACNGDIKKAQKIISQLQIECNCGCK